MPFGKLARAEAELVILYVAYARQNEYELRHHERIARTCKVSADTIAHAGDPTWPGHPARTQAMLKAAQQVVAHQQLDDEAWTDLREHLSEPETIELLMLITQYNGLATVIQTLRIEPEPWTRPSALRKQDQAQRQATDQD